MFGAMRIRAVSEDHDPRRRPVRCRGCLRCPRRVRLSADRSELPGLYGTDRSRSLFDLIRDIREEAPYLVQYEDGPNRTYIEAQAVEAMIRIVPKIELPSDTISHARALPARRGLDWRVACAARAHAACEGVELDTHDRARRWQGRADRNRAATRVRNTLFRGWIVGDQHGSDPGYPSAGDPSGPSIRDDARMRVMEHE